MRKFFNKHPEFTLASIAAVLFVIATAYYFWGITTLIANLDKAINAGAEKRQQTEFNLGGASALDLKGLVK